MIRIGLRDEQKNRAIESYIASNGIRSVVVISPAEFMLERDDDMVTYDDAIEYPTFYRLLQEVDRHTLIVLNECLRTQNRYDLTYNCIRHFLNQTRHQIVFQQLPQIDRCDDFMILFDFDTQSRWKQRKFDLNLILDNSDVECQSPPIRFRAVAVPTSDKTRQRYKREKARRFASLGNKDPHTLPRNLHLLGGDDKKSYIIRSDATDLPLFSNGVERKWYVARNQRLNLDSVVSYHAIKPGFDKSVAGLIDFPHRFIDFSDFVKIAWQFDFDVLLADLKIDRWYYERYTEWSGRINETCTSLQQ